VLDSFFFLSLSDFFSYSFIHPLLLSNLAQSNSGRKNVVREKKRRDVESPEVGVSSGTTSRSSTRLSSQPRRSYAPLPKQKAVVAKPVMRAGTRKSARISNGGLRSSLKEEDDDDDDRSMQMENTLNSRNMSTLRRIKNPVPMISVDYEEAEEEEYDRAPLPNRDVHGNILFENKNRHFMPNLTPEEMLRGGIFGGTAFRPYISSVTGQKLSPHQDLHEFPSNWYSGLEEDEQLTSSTYDPQMNRFGVKAGQSLEEWEKARWVRRQDPRGWWQVSSFFREA
jgi:hypothetical protein